MVDYNLVIIIIPSVLMGSTIGSLVNHLLPFIVADSLIICLLIAFSIKFFFKLKSLIQVAKQNQQEKKRHKQLTNKQFFLNHQNQYIQSKILTNSWQPNQRNAIESKPMNIELAGWVKSQKDYQLIVLPTTAANPYWKELQLQLKYEGTHHWSHIFSILGLFIFFQILAFLAQGKIISFSVCSKYYGIGIGALFVVYIGVVIVTNCITKRKMQRYKTIGFEYQYPLDQLKYFLLICIGSFLGGFNGGAFAIGNSVTIILTLSYLDIEQIVVSATVGFQVVFASSASLCQALATDKIELKVAGLFFGITFVGGGLLSHLLSRYIDRMNRDRINICLVAIIMCLTSSSSLSMIANMVLGYFNFGANYMNSAAGLC